MAAVLTTEEVATEVVYSAETGWTPRPTEVFGTLSDECRQVGEKMGFEYSPDGLWYREVTPTVLGAVFGTP